MGQCYNPSSSKLSRASFSLCSHDSICAAWRKFEGKPTRLGCSLAQIWHALIWVGLAPYYTMSWNQEQKRKQINLIKGSRSRGHPAPLVQLSFLLPFFMQLKNVRAWERARLQPPTAEVLCMVYLCIYFDQPIWTSCSWNTLASYSFRDGYADSQCSFSVFTPPTSRPLPHAHTHNTLHWGPVC